MSRPSIFSTFSQALGRLVHGAPDRRAGRAPRRRRTASRVGLEGLESRVLLTSYIVEQLDTLGGVTSQASAINAEGDVVGSVVFSISPVKSHAVLWSRGQPGQDLGTLGGPISSASAINTLGEIVGDSYTGGGSNHQPFVRQPGGTMTSLNSLMPSSFTSNGNSLLSATGVNDTGDIVGQAHFNLIDPTPNTAYSFMPTSPPTANDAFAGMAGQATAVSGTTSVATLMPSANKTEAAVQSINTPNAVTVLPAVPLQVSSEVWAISAPNSSGAQFAVGDALLTNGLSDVVEWTIPKNLSGITVVDLSRIIGSSINGSGLGVNAAGVVVGAGVDQGSGQADAFIDLGGPLVSLNSLLPAGSGITLTSATGINDAGQICATGTLDGKPAIQSHAFLLTPFDSGPPHAKLTFAPDINAAGATTYAFTVTYSDAVGLNTSSLNNGEIQVTGPGFSQAAMLTSTSGPPNQVVAKYTINAPGGTWDFSDDGTYTIALNGGIVTNASGDALTGGTLGHFVTAINVVRGSVSGTAFKDVNNDGILDPGDPGVANTDIFIDLNGDGHLDAGDPISLTDANGNYSFGGVLPGTYNLMEAGVESQLVTSPSGGVLTLTLSAGQNLTGENFGNVARPEILAVNGQFPTGNFQVQTAQLGQPATTLTIAGVNFATDDTFYFGNDQATASLTNLETTTGANQGFNLQVPALATTGALVVFDPHTLKYTKLSPTFTVNSYRNINGFSFGNPGTTPDGATDPGFSFDELTTVYGSGQTEIDLGLGTIDNPLADAELALINWLVPPSNGLCLGYSVTSTRLWLGIGPPYNVGLQPQYLGDFPTMAPPGTPRTVWQLTNSYPLHELLRLTHLEQTSAEVIGNFIHQVAVDEVDGASNLISVVQSQLAIGLPCPVSFFHVNGNLTSGHCVLAYNVQNNPNGSVTLDIYDPDLHYDQSGEEDGKQSTAVPVPGIEDGTAHAQAFGKSTITIGTDNHWIYNGGAGPASGGMASIAAAPLYLFDGPHTLLASLSGLAELAQYAVFGSAAETQVTDSAGHTLLNADGTPNTDPSTMIPNAARYVGGLNSPPLDVVQGTGNFMQTITGTGSGTYMATSSGSGAMATISGMATASGQIDQFGLDPASDMLTFIPGAKKELNAELIMTAADGSQHQARLSTTASSGAAQTLQVQGNHFVYHNAGGAGLFELSLTSNASGTEQTFTTGRMSLAAGDSVDILPSDWTNLQTAMATVVVTHMNGSKTTATIANDGQGLAVSASEGASFTASVATFPNRTPAGKTALIDWGDQTTSAGTVTASGANVTVAGTHTYARPGYYPTSITLADSSGPIAQASSQATVTFNPFSLASTTFVTYGGVPVSGTLATLTDVLSGETASDFVASIDWGDNTTSSGTLQTTTTAGQFLVQGAHTWASTGTYTVTVTVSLNGSESGPGQTLAIGSNPSFSGTIAQFNLPIPGSATTDYVATINWGDNTTSPGTLTLQGNGSVILSGSHSYAIANQSYPTSFTLTGGPSAIAFSTAVAQVPLGTVTGTLFDDLNGNGTMDAGEGGLPNQVVFIDENNDGKFDPGDPFALTDASGAYTITNVPAGNIVVRESVPIGFRVDAPAAGAYTQTLSPGQTLAGLNFANTQLALISGTVFLDSNGNGTRDPSEPGQPNQIVYLDVSNTGVLTTNDPTAVTDATGAFAFTVFPGTYVVRLVPSSDVTLTTPAVGAYSVTLGDGQTNSGGLFGEKLLYALVSSVSPDVGPTTGGTAVTITGAFFTPTCTVKFGTVSASSVTFNSSTSLTAIAPAEGPGTVDVTVSTSAGPSPLNTADQYTYASPPTITGIAPSSGPSSGGTVVILTGTNFTPASTVLFGAGPALGVTFVSATTLTAVAPAGTADTTVDVTVATAGGTSALSAADKYTYYGPFSKYLVSVVGPSTVSAGTNFVVTVQAADAAGTPVTSYSGPATVTTTITPATTASNFPVTVSLSSSGFGFFLGNVQKAGSYTISAASGSFTGSTTSPVTITAAAPAKLAFAAQPVSTPTGDTLPAVTVQILDAFGNLTADSTDTVTVSVASGPGGFIAASTLSATAAGGVAKFANLVLVVPGSYTLGAVVAGKFNGPNSNAFTVKPLQVLAASFAGTPSGFSLQFNAPYLVNSLTPALYGSGFGATATVKPTVTLTQTTGTPPSGFTLPYQVAGSVILTPATNSLTFLATNTVSAASTNAPNNTPLLADGTYVVRVTSSGANGLQALNSGGGYLDGTNAGTPGHDYTATFTVGAKAAGDAVLWVPATADGPGEVLVAPGKNQAGGGYPVYLDSTGSATSVHATLSYNPSLLTVTATSTATFTVTVPTAGTAMLSYSGPALAAGVQTAIGFLTATVPSGTAGSPMPYKAKDLLHLSGVTLNGSSTGVVTSDGLHVVAYVGDADGDGAYTSNDAVLLTRVGLQTDSGLAAYPLIDPVIITDTDGSGFTPADAALQVNEAGVGLATSNLPIPPIPSGVTFAPIGNNVDPTVSVGREAWGVGRDGRLVMTVPLNIDDAHPAGSTGLTEGHLALIYDPRVFTVSAADVHLGPVLLAGTGWNVDPTINKATGQIAIAFSSTTPIGAAIGGSLVTIDFHQLVSGAAGSGKIALVDSVNLDGHVFTTELEDAQGVFTLTPVPTTVSDSRINSVVMLLANSPAVTIGAAASVEVTDVERHTAEMPVATDATGLSRAPITNPTEGDFDAGEHPSETVHGLPANPHDTVSVLGFLKSLNVGVPVPGLAFQFGSALTVDALVSSPMTSVQQIADRQFLTPISTWGTTSTSVLLAQPSAEYLDYLNWDLELPGLDWQEIRDPRPAPAQAVYDRYFALMVDETTEQNTDADLGLMPPGTDLARQSSGEL
jgi:hypothetical protein